MLLLFGIWMAILTVLLCIEQIRLAKQNERIRKLERSLEMWKLAAEHLTRENERMSRELMS